MAITSPLVLAADVLLLPVTDLAPEVRARFDCEDGDFAITRPRSRAPSKIIERRGAELLKEFRTPKTIVQAVIDYSRATRMPADDVLAAAYPLIHRLMSARFLVEAESGDAADIAPLLAIGETVGSVDIVRCIHVVDDSELYHASDSRGHPVALKIARTGRGEMRRKMAREATILAHLDGSVGPRLLDRGVIGDREYLVMEWCAGVPVSLAAEERRRRDGIGARSELHALCCAVADAYSRLHLRNVLHGDVHPRNVLVDGTGGIKIIDFALARFATGGDDFDEPERGGIGFFFEPEYARARLARQPPPPSSALGEQFALGALLYYLMTGAHYVEFSIERPAMLRQIAFDSPLPFGRRACRAWPALEEILARALSKEPPARFGSISELTRELRTAAPPVHETSPGGVAVPSAEALLNRVLARVNPGESVDATDALRTPTCSVTYGAAGIAYALYRIACIRSDPRLLSAADVWCSRAARQAEDDAAFYDAALGITVKTVGRTSVYHTAPGIHCVQALVSHAMGDAMSLHEALDAFLSSARVPCPQVDLTLGRSGLLLATALLLGVERESQSLRTFGEDLFAGLWSELSDRPPIGERSAFGFLGIAHGWAGLLYAAMLWCRASGREVAPAVQERLHQLAGCAEPTGRGARWRRTIRGRSPDYLPGWCNGSAGFVHLWTLAHAMLRDDRYRALAEQAAWNAWEEPDGVANLCCGLAGRAYGLLNLYKAGGDRGWLGRARALAERAAAGIEGSGITGSLYKGDVGVAVLAADVLAPEEACMPLFEHEGWPH